MIEKLGAVGCDMVESVPVAFRGRLYRFDSVRENYRKRLPDSDLESHEGREQRVVRSRDLIRWEPNPLSDNDFCERQGKLHITCSWGNQRGNEFLAEAVCEGTQAEFLWDLHPGG
ncbi:MAG: hypothetical protein IT210_08570 [Armatimonadetes bacterium]|nr:hypothetical protein [Armatimonadota bacterium]